jgi:hypothetical protein
VSVLADWHTYVVAGYWFCLVQTFAPWPFGSRRCR